MFSLLSLFSKSSEKLNYIVLEKPQKALLELQKNYKEKILLLLQKLNLTLPNLQTKEVILEQDLNLPLA